MADAGRCEGATITVFSAYGTKSTQAGGLRRGARETPLASPDNNVALADCEERSAGREAAEMLLIRLGVVA